MKRIDENKINTYTIPFTKREVFMNLKTIFVTLLSLFIFQDVNACQPCFLVNDEIVFITEEEFQELQNIFGCYDRWLGDWECCQCRFINGSYFYTCQHCHHQKCN